ncbi:AI-2E family transporter, partial [Odoribacter splanchnicus]
MNSVTKYVLGIVALAGAIFFSWYFFSVIVYILVAAVISFIGRPIIDLLGRVKIRGYRLPDGLKAGITVICLWGLFILFFSTIIPLAIREFQSLGNVSVSNIVSELESPIEDAGHFMKHYGLMDEDQDVDAYVTDLLSKVFNVGQLKTWFGT